MYVNYVNDRKQLGYKVVKDMNCGIELVLISESTLLMIMNFPWLINWSGTPWTNTNTNTEDKK